MILDGHNDVLEQLWAGVPGTFATGLPGHLDAAKARAGGLGGGFFACYVPSPAVALVRARRARRGRIGAQAVAIGSDFDGATIPRAIGDASGTSRLLDALRERGWSAEQLDGVASANYLRVLRATWR